MVIEDVPVLVTVVFRREAQAIQLAWAHGVLTFYLEVFEMAVVSGAPLELYFAA